jgi:uncharacterized protein YodC (DUF2158 family)
MSFKAGDTVQLKSGGPRMTITNVGTYGGKTGANCSWFEGSTPQAAVYPLEALKDSPEPTPIQTGRLTR